MVTQKSFFCQCMLSSQIECNQAAVADHIHRVHNFSKGRSMADARVYVTAEKLRRKHGHLRDIQNI